MRVIVVIKKISIEHVLSYAVVAFFYFTQPDSIVDWEEFSLGIALSFTALYATNAYYSRKYNQYWEMAPLIFIIIAVVLFYHADILSPFILLFSGLTLLTTRSAWAGHRFRQKVYRKINHSEDYPDNLKRFEFFHTVAAILAVGTYPLVEQFYDLDYKASDRVLWLLMLPTAVCLLIGHIRVHKHRERVGFYDFESFATVIAMSLNIMLYQE